MQNNIETAKRPTRTAREQAQVFMSRFEELAENPALTIPNVLLHHPEDQLLVTVASMRRRTPNEYEAVVSGLQQMASSEQGKQRKQLLESLAGTLIEVGELLYPGKVDFH